MKNVSLRQNARSQSTRNQEAHHYDDCISAHHLGCPPPLKQGVNDLSEKPLRFRKILDFTKPSKTSVYKGLLDFACKKNVLLSKSDKYEHIGKVSQFRYLSVFYACRNGTYMDKI